LSSEWLVEKLQGYEEKLCGGWVRHRNALEQATLWKTPFRELTMLFLFDSL